jgi:hypothetical protein
VAKSRRLGLNVPGRRARHGLRLSLADRGLCSAPRQERSALDTPIDAGPDPLLGDRGAGRSSCGREREARNVTIPGVWSRRQPIFRSAGRPGAPELGKPREPTARWCGGRAR